MDTEERRYKKELADLHKSFVDSLSYHSYDPCAFDMAAYAVCFFKWRDGDYYSREDVLDVLYETNGAIEEVIDHMEKYIDLTNEIREDLRNERERNRVQSES